MDVEPCLRLTQRTFEFGEQQVTVACRQPPEELGRITLTLQTEAPAPAADGGAAGGSLAGDGGAPAAVPDPIGLDLWPASIALCHYLAAHPQVVAGQRLLELGAGERAARQGQKVRKASASAAQCGCGLLPLDMFALEQSLLRGLCCLVRRPPPA